ncbi:MAG: hypothetical protein COC05_00920 [Gammaproteobacteria bacterium]|nr:MAG: hypothetical protein COC05_00920 [Gammaproteobacteria bacterium]
MKETVLDVLIYLFQNYMDGENEITSNQESLTEELVEAGFAQGEVDKAFAWLEGLTTLPEHKLMRESSQPASMRIFAPSEQARLNVECRGFLIFLEQTGILDSVSRELIIDRIMALETREIDLDHVKWVVLMVLFNQPGQDTNNWIEDLVLESAPMHLH